MGIGFFVYFWILDFVYFWILRIYRQREILYLRFNQNLNNEAIADIMGVNKQSVANLFYRTLVELKEKWVGSLTSLIFTLFTCQIFF